MQTKILCFILTFMCLSNSAVAYLSESDKQLAYVASNSQDISVSEIRKQIDILNSSISKLNSEINEINSNHKKTSDEVKKLESEQKEIEAKLATELDNFNHITTTILKLGNVPSEVIVMQDALQVQQKRSGLLSTFKKQLTVNITDSKKSLADLVENIEVQKQKQLELTSINKRLEQKRSEFYELRKQQKLVLRLPAEIRAKMKKEAVLLAQNLDLNSFLNNVKKQQIKVRTSLSDEKLPVQGKIVENFHDKDRITQVPVQGITIEGFARGKIKAIHDGRVIYSGVFREYGHLVILEHQTGAHSLYAGFGKAIVDVGDYLNAGDLLGFLPAEEEPSFYYEVRINNKAQDPNDWLQKDLNKA